MTAPRGLLRREIIVTVLLTTFVLGVGIAIGALLLGRGDEPAGSRAEAPTREERESDVAPPRLEGARAAEASRRLDEIEQAVAALRADSESAKGQMKPLLDLYARFQEEGATRPAPGEAIPVALERAATGDDARKVARELGLDAARREAMATRYAEILAQIEALERRHASVSKEGDVTTIQVGKFAEEGERVLQEWRDWIDRTLSPTEKEKYESSHREALLFGHRSGAFDRTVKIDESGGMLRVSESIATTDGAMDVLEMTAPAGARDLALEGYRHLLGEPAAER